MRMLIYLGITCSILAQTPVAIPIFNTGTVSPGVLASDASVDAHYKLITSADPAYPGPNAYVVNNAWPIATNLWLASGPNSKWIGPRADAGSGNLAGAYTYRTTFDLTGLNISTAALTVKVASDDPPIIIKINGTAVGPSSDSFLSLTPFPISTGFIAGINTLDFVVTNYTPNPNPTGLRVEISGTAQPAPVPAIGPLVINGVLAPLVYNPATGVISCPNCVVLDSGGNVSIPGTLKTGASGSQPGEIVMPTLKSGSGLRYVCVDSTGTFTSSAVPCQGT